MKWLTLPILTASVIAIAGEDSTYKSDREALCHEIKEILIDKQFCTDANDCSRRDILFCSPAINGIGIQLWGISDYEVIGPALIAASQSYSNRTGKMRVYFDVYKTTKAESLSKPFWPFDPKIASFKFKGDR